MTFLTNIPTVEPEQPTPTWTPNTWVQATWEEFRAIANHPTYAKATCYYFDDQLRIETRGIGPNHAVDNSLIHVAIALYCALKGIPLRSLIYV